MKELERLWRLPQPQFESGDKILPSVVARRLIQGHGAAPDIINPIFDPFLSPEVRTLKAQIEKAATETKKFTKPAWQLLKDNLFYLPGQLFLRASPFHCDNWLRDTFIGTLFEELPELEMHLLSQFENPLTHPQLPTTRLLASNRIWAFDDESTMLALVWRVKLARQGIPMSSKELNTWQERWAWIKKHVQDGLYVSPAGTERSWLDTLRFPKPDIITYNQGIYAVAASAAQIISLEKDSLVVEEAKEGYRRLTHRSGRLKLSFHFPYKDVSALFGEFLSLTLFGENLLPDEVVVRTVETFPRSQFGYPVVVKEDNSYLQPNHFKRPYRPGNYHNGAEWPVFSATAQAAAEIHGLEHNNRFWQDLFYRLQATNHAEYVYTAVPGESGPPYNYKRRLHFWNTAAYQAAKSVLKQEELIAISQLIKPREVGIIYSEASQMPGSTL